MEEVAPPQGECRVVADLRPLCVEISATEPWLAKHLQSRKFLSRNSTLRTACEGAVALKPALQHEMLAELFECRSVLHDD